MIKYYDKGNTESLFGYYGKDKSTWNSDLDYGNEYVKVYFRIDTPLYDCNNGFTTTEDRDRWITEASKLIKSLGILEDCGYTVEHSKDKRAYLYAHPQNISGVVLKNDVKRVAEAISKMELSSIRWVDLYETVYVISDSEYEEYLDGKQEEICKKIFEVSATTRTTKYYNTFDIAMHVAKAVKLNRLGLKDGDYSGGQTVDYVFKMIDRMIKEGYLKSVVNSNGKYIRSLNKTEQKKMKIKM